jgi:hypothetical protein
MILTKLSNKDLYRICTLNKYINSIYENDNFWNMRIRLHWKVKENELQELTSYLNLHGKELYLYLVSQEYLKDGFKYTDLLINFLITISKFCKRSY